MSSIRARTAAVVAIATIIGAFAAGGCGVDSQRHAHVLPDSALPSGLRPLPPSTTTEPVRR